MKAVGLRFGGPDVLELAVRPLPTPASGADELQGGVGSAGLVRALGAEAHHRLEKAGTGGRHVPGFNSTIGHNQGK